jgi:putative tryptophan/tyrosine transport system substrate-binding protein
MATKTVVALLVGLALASIHPVEAQQPGKLHRIGYLESGSASGSTHLLDAFRQGLHELGHVEGKNIDIEYRYAEGKTERLPDLAAELVRLKVDVILVRATGEALAVKETTNTIPIIMLNVGNPMAAGLIASLARPGGNITGLTQMTPEVGGKRLELLKEVVPKMSRLAVLTMSRPDTGLQLQMKEIEAAAQALGVQLQPLEVRGPEDIDSAFQAAANKRVSALIVLAHPPFFAERRRIGELAVKSRLPTMYPQSDYVDADGLMSYGVNIADLYRRAAVYVDKILKGAKPAELPVEQPTKFEFVINLKTAKQIGLTIPPNVLARADKVIK